MTAFGSMTDGNKQREVRGDDQRLRMRRWSMALGTYALNTSGVLIVQMIGLDSMPGWALGLMLLTAVAGNLALFLLFWTGLNLRATDPSLTLPQIVFAHVWGVIPLYYLANVRLLVVLAMLPSFCFGMLRLDLRGHLKIAGSFFVVYASVLVAEFVQGRAGLDLTLEVFQLLVVMMIVGWFTLFGSFMSNLRHRLRNQRVEIERINSEMEGEIEARKETQSALELALGRVKTLTGFIPICANCKKVRQSSGNWDSIESYIAEHSEASLSHCICPDCLQDLYPEYQDP